MYRTSAADTLFLAFGGLLHFFLLALVEEETVLRQSDVGFRAFTIFIFLSSSYIFQTSIKQSTCIKRSVRHSPRVIAQYRFDVLLKINSLKD